MKSKVFNKIIASLIIMILTVSDWGLLVGGAYAAYEELEKQKSQTNNKNVEFDAYFKSSEKTHSTTVLKSEKGTMYVNLNVKNGYLKQGTVSFDNPNFVVFGEIPEGATIDGNTLKLDQISGEKEIEIPFYFEKQEQISLDYFDRESNVNLSAIYIDENGKEKEISGSIKIHLNWSENVIAKVEQQVEKVIDLGAGRTLVQVGVKDYIENSSVPAESTKLEIKTLQIPNVEIENIDVYAVNTTQSNGVDKGIAFSKDNWVYNKEEANIAINIENAKTEDNKISWKSGADEFKVIYILKSAESLENKTVTLSAKGEIKYNDNAVAFEEEKEASLVLSGSLINSDILVTESLNKGYIYAGSEETIYESKVVTEISYSEMIDYINIDMSKDQFIYENGDRLTTNSIIYKRTEISKTAFDTIFGEEGKLEIYNGENKIAEINKDSQANEAGNIVINYESEINSIEIITSKPIAEGKLEINNVKAIKAQTGYSRENVIKLKQIKTNAQIKTNITEDKKEKLIALNETVTKAELIMLTENLSTVVKNADVEMRVLFRTDSNMYDLYKNPVIEIELPSQVKDVTVKSIASAFGEGFTLREHGVFDNSEGKKVIKIALEGEQSKYAIDISEGMSLTIKADMTLDKKSGSSEEIVKLRYLNERAIAYDNEGLAETKVKVEAPSGVVAINSMANYNVEGETATSLSSKEQIGELEILTDKKVATMTIDVINNYDKEIVNPTILGRIPFEGNKKVTGENLGSTFTASVVKGIEKQEGIEAGNYKIYYSTNEEATGDIQKPENGWTENIQEAGEVKSYLIELEGYKMQQGEAMSFTYDIEIPEGLNHNEAAFGTYAVSYGIEEAGELRQETIVAPTVGATTGEGPELEVSLEADIANGATVEEASIIKYTVKVKNIGEVPANNVKIVGQIPERAMYVKKESSKYEEYTSIKEYTETVSTIPAGETYTISYEVKAGSYRKEEGENNNIIAKAKITADDLGKELETNSCNNTIIKGNIRLELESIFDEKDILTENLVTVFSGRVINVTSEKKENVVVTYNIPNGLEITEVTINGSSEGFSTNNNVATFNIGTIQPNKTALIVIKAKVKKFAPNEYERKLVSKIEMDGKVSNEIVNYAYAPKITAEQTSNKDKYISTKSQVEYYVEIANSGKAQVKNLILEDILPEGLALSEINVVIGNQDKRTYSTKKVTLNIPPEATAKITIVAKVLENIEDGKEVTNLVKVSADNIESFELNNITHIVVNDEEVVTPDGDKVTTHSISGRAWEDTNADGKRDTNEPKLSNVEVLLIDNTTGSVARKASSNDNQITTTNSNGEYKFTEVKEGNYMVVFLYDATKYNVTEYKKAGILESQNSDVVKTTIKYDGNNRTAGVTEVFKVGNTSVSGIDIGLIKMNSAVFGIDKVVTKMVMTDPKNSKTVNFDNSKLAKMDVDGKYINSTNLVMEYKIKVTNQGSIDGYVKKIVDYVPSAFKFSTDLNKDWYLGSNGEVYNTSLANTLIKAGETKEVTLVLTKKMTENGNGIVHNTAAIVEVYNEYGADNIINNDNTRAAADVIIGIKTGKEITYVLLILVIIAFMGTGIYFINNKVFNKVIDKKVKYLNDDEK